METKKDYLIEHMIKNLDNVNAALNKLSESATKTNENVFEIKLKVFEVLRDIKNLKDAPPLTYKAPIVDIFHDEMRKLKVEDPKKNRDIIKWLLVILVALSTLYLFIEKLKT